MPRSLSIPALVLILSSARAAHAEPVVLDGLVARIDAQPLFRSDVMERAKPYILALPQKDQADAKKIKQLYREVLDRMIEEHLIAQDCIRAQIAVEKHEVDRAIDEVSKTNKLSRKALLAAAEQQGFSEAAYRAEVQRQILDAKWAGLILRPRVNAPVVGTDAEKADATTKLIDEERKKTLARLRTEALVEVKP